MSYEIQITIKVDKGANFLEVSGNNCNVVKELIELALYDIDDITVTECEVMKRD
ncbi:hypothetical protein N9465_00285 [Gammaproteobacteria bacterium]|jgi:hypothetical protein|nr:hypothetical protein [Gammaproteobacteria bacterium]MDC3368031.1 hypothetical protein [bacterium]|tara:strand:+ start:544 stop:705 length:162 start_codon:yes stop_codon:yes gene_type:complete